MSGVGGVADVTTKSWGEEAAVGLMVYIIIRNRIVIHTNVI